jgi:hypothetical protein
MRRRKTIISDFIAKINVTPHRSVASALKQSFVPIHPASAKIESQGLDSSGQLQFIKNHPVGAGLKRLCYFNSIVCLNCLYFLNSRNLLLQLLSNTTPLSEGKESVN